MLKKVHMRLTLLCAGIPLALLLAISCIYLFVTEANLRKNGFVSFQSDMNTMLANLDQQMMISHEWISQNGKQGAYKIRVWDNGTPLLFNQLHDSEEETLLFQNVYEYYTVHFDEPTSLSPYFAYHKEFLYPATRYNREDYYACVAFSYRGNGTLSFVILKSLAPLNHQLMEQRLFFILLFLLSAVILFLFAAYLTKKLLIPV